MIICKKIREFLYEDIVSIIDLLKGDLKFPFHNNRMPSFLDTTEKTKPTKREKKENAANKIVTKPFVAKSYKARNIM